MHTPLAGSAQGPRQDAVLLVLRREERATMYLDRLRLDDRVALVTGAAGGIGLSIVEALAEAGARVTIADLAQGPIDEAIALMASRGYRADGVVMDVTDPARVAEVADDLAARAGRIDILVNNAGIARSETNAEDVADEQWRNVLDVNLNGTFWCRSE